jgi:PAS domain S-box-containing protein
MNSSTTWDNRTFRAEATEKLSSLRRAMLFLVLSLLLVVAGDVFIYLNRGGAHEHPVLQTSQWFLQSIAGAGVGGVAVFLITMRRLTAWKNAWSERLTATDLEAREGKNLLQKQLTDCRISEDRQRELRIEMEKRLAALTQTNAGLREELDKRKVAQVTLQHHRQELARSNDVLGMHVQARTEQVERLQQRYELILNSAGEGICGLDAEGKATFVNPAAAKMTGWEIRELLGRHERDLFAPQQPGVPAANPLLRRRDGTIFPAELVKTPIYENGREAGAVLIFKDITERKQTEERLARKADELARSNAELEQFAFVASHDLQEPLRKIQAFGDRLKIKCEGIVSGDAHDYLERMQNAAARMQTLINDLLSFSRVIRSSQPFVQLNLGELIREVLGDLEVRIERTGAVVEVGAMPVIDADPLQMRQLMQNLISNALKFQPSGQPPLIRIQARMAERMAAGASTRFCQLTVQDNGIGFEEKHLDKIFAVFQRLHGRSEYEGTGIGLAVCRRIVERHGGTITAKSRPGQGATFIVTMPIGH